MIRVKKVYTIIFTQLLLFCIYSTGQVIKVGAELTEQYFSLLKDKKIALVSNQTSMVNQLHLVDTLLKSGFNVVKIFCPEHGFRGSIDAGQKVDTYKDQLTGLKVISLYGKNKKPKSGDLSNVDLVIFDIQDVGARFYTYLSTLHFVMESCAENKIELMILDRPNPNGFYVDGPVLDLKYRSFVGLDPVPVVHGMTMAEFAQMINGEKWLRNGMQCKLTVVKCEGYTHKSKYQLPVKPSPNLINMRSVYLYPSLALFEGTIVNVGRGTDFPFEVFGHPDMKNTTFEYTPKSKPGANSPSNEGQKCRGVDLRQLSDSDLWKIHFSVQWLIFAYNNSPDKDGFFNKFFYNLSGNADLQSQIENGLSEKAIRQGWQYDLESYKKIRKEYLLYEDFE